MNKKQYEKIKEAAKEFVESFAKDDSDLSKVAELKAFEKMRKVIVNSTEFVNGKPLVGNLWYIKNYSYIPGISYKTKNISANPVLILDENKSRVEILFKNEKFWIKRFYLSRPAVEMGKTLVENDE